MARPGNSSGQLALLESPRARRGGGVPPYISYIGMCPPPPSGRVFLRHFGLKTGMVFEGTGGACVNVFIMSIPDVRKKEKYANSKWI